MSNITPKQRRNVIEGDLENYVKSENDFLSLRKSFIDLNFSLVLACEHDEQRAKKYLDAAREIQGLEDKQDKRGKWEINEDNKDKGIDKLTPLYVELQEGQIDVKRKYGDEVGKPIDADRFRYSYSNATKMLEQTIEKRAERETKKENTEQKGREI